jgi:hypothetical protein
MNSTKTITVAILAILGTAIIALFFFVHANVASIKSIDVSDLLQNSTGYDGKSVEVSGTAVQGAGLFGVGGFRLRSAQSDQEIFVISESGIPATNSKTTVKGIFKQVVVAGGFQYGIIIPDAWCNQALARGEAEQLFALLCHSTGRG